MAPANPSPVTRAELVQTLIEVEQELRYTPSDGKIADVLRLLANKFEKGGNGKGE